MNIYEFMSVGENEKPLDRIVTDGGFAAIFRSIACIGDSLASGEFESKDAEGKMHYHDCFDYSWGQFIARSTGATVYNFSRGGMTAKEYIETYADKMGFWDEGKRAQAYIIALGVNDLFYHGFKTGSVDDINTSDPSKNAPTFAGYYASIIQKIKKLQPRAKIFLVSIPRAGDEKDETIRKPLHDLLDSLAEFFDRTYHIDLYTYAPLEDAAYKAIFRLGHMTPTGYLLTARIIESYIDYIIRKNPGDFSQVGFIGTDLYYKDE